MNLGSACCHAPGEFRLVNTTALHLGANLLDHNPHQRPGGDFFVNALFFEEVIKVSAAVGIWLLFHIPLSSLAPRRDPPWVFSEFSCSNRELESFRHPQRKKRLAR